MPGAGRISARIHALGPKTKRLLDGALREERVPKGNRLVRLRPSLPTARSDRLREARFSRTSRIGATTGYALPWS